MKRLLTTLLAAAGTALAANLPDVNVLGFSTYGDRFAFEEVWTADGSGFPFRRLHVVNVLENTYAERFTLGGEDFAGREDALQRQYRQRREQTLDRYGISGQHPGAPVYQSDLNVPLNYGLAPDREHFTVFFQYRPVQVRLREQEVPNACDSTGLIPDSEAVTGFQLTVNGRTLQSDQQLPDWRACAYGYKVIGVRVFQGRIAVLLRAFMPGFEGPDAPAMVVTGRWRD